MLNALGLIVVDKDDTLDDTHEHIQNDIQSMGDLASVSKEDFEEDLDGDLEEDLEGDLDGGLEGGLEGDLLIYTSEGFPKRCTFVLINHSRQSKAAINWKIVCMIGK